MIKRVAAIAIFTALLLGQARADEPNCDIPMECECDDTVAEVCGADGKTYMNACMARCKGVWTCEGTCPQECDAPAGWDWFRCETLPHYWKCLADDFGIDHCRLGFNITEDQWYIDGMPTCLGWGEYDDHCDFDCHFCAGAAARFYGFGAQQMAALADMINMNQTIHPLCPLCPKAPEGMVEVCHDGKKFSFPTAPKNMKDFGTPGSMAKLERGTWLTCDCEEVHRGHHIEEGTYWANVAASAGLDPMHLTHYSGVWYYNGKYTCVGKGKALDMCSEMELVCAGEDGMTYGFGLSQMHEVAMASMLPTGTHAFCPLA